MKTKLTFLITIIISLLIYNTSFAQVKDTVDVIPGFNTLSDQIELDLKNGVNMENRVYRLANDSPYLLDHALEINFPLTIISPKGGKPALVQAAKDINGKAPTDLFHMYKDLYVENVAFSGVDNGGAVILRIFVLQKDSLSAVAVNCIFELARLNVFSSNGLFAKVKFINCIFNNSLTDNNLYNGRAFDDRQNVVESFYAENCSFINMRSPLHFWGTLVKNYYVNHCTFYNSTSYVRGFNIGVNVTFTNNLLVNTGIYPVNYNPATNIDTAEGFQIPGVIDVDSLVHQLASETDKKWIIKNNVYWFTEDVKNYYSTLNDTLKLRPWISEHDRAYASKYPDRYIIDDAISVDPGFVNPPHADSLIKWVDLYLNGVRDASKLPNTRYAPNGYVDANGVAILSYGLVDLSYNKTSPLYNAGTDGKPIGDLQWFKDIPSDVDETNNTIPNDFVLFQNFPNPFNPTTNIQFILPRPSHTKLIVYNILGQEVSKLVDGYYQSGKYNVYFDGSKFSSGIYFYQLQAENVVKVRKMIIAK